MNKSYVKCISSAGQSYITTGKAYEVLDRTRDFVTVHNAADEPFAYPAKLFSPIYLQSVLGEHKWVDVIHAWADGAAIQCMCSTDTGGWTDTLYPSFDNSANMYYRVKPVNDEAIYKLRADIAAAWVEILKSQKIHRELIASLETLESGE